MKIAISGKGGCGKSTITVLLSRAFLSMGYEVTIFDTDESNVGLAKMLGFEGEIKQVMDLYGGKQGFKRVLNEGQEIAPDLSLVTINCNGVKLVRIGKIERGGEGCACLMGILAKEVLSKLKLKEREVVLVDTDAGIEHFGRGVDQAVNAVLFVVDPTYDSVLLAERAYRMACDLGLAKFMAVLNKVDDETGKLLTQRLSKANIKVLGKVRYDPDVVRSMLIGEPVKASIAMQDVISIAKALLEEMSYNAN